MHFIFLKKLMLCINYKMKQEFTYYTLEKPAGQRY